MHVTSWFCATCGASNDSTLATCFACGQLRKDDAREDVGMDVLQDRYRLLSQVGTGGFGVVYKAIDTQNEDRLVAVKQINLRGLSPQKMIEATDAFNREIQLLSPLRHPNLPRIYDHFTDPDHWYLVMDYIEGETLEHYLEQRLKKRAYSGQTFLPLNETLSIAEQLCTVLAYLHSRHPPIIFRDLKPSNIMRARGGHLYLIDFGIARHFKPGQARDTTPFGSPGYAAPEQYGKAQTTPRADIYSLGALLHHLLTGADPAETPFRFMPLPDISLPEMQTLDALIARMVQLDSHQRPATAGEVQHELRYIRYLSTRVGQRIWHPPQSQPLPPPWASGVQSSGGSTGQQQVQMQRQSGIASAPKPRGRSRRKFLTRDLAGGFLGLVIAGSIGVALLNALDERHYRAGASDPIPQQQYQNFRKISAIALTQDGKMAAYISVDGTVQILNISLNGIQTATTFNVADYNGIAAWSPDNSYLALANLDGSLNIYLLSQSQTEQPWKIFNGSSDEVVGMAWSPDGKLIATVGHYQALRLIDARYGTIVFNDDSSIFSDARSVAWSPDSKRVVISGNFRDTQFFMQVWDVAQHKQLFSFGTTTARLVAWSPDGKHIASLDENSTLTIWDASNGGYYRSFYTSNAPRFTQLAWSPDGRYLALSTIQEPLLVMDITNSHQITYDLPPANLRSVAWLSNTQLFMIDEDQQIQVINVGDFQA
ncbi:MAG TPA: protein kinase [Ktedonobacteraceae bacterium]|nr:protein kinase [Ktedonobacteraceae bacterium]